MPSDQATSYMPLFLQDLFPLRSVIVTLQFTQSAEPGFFHQASLSAFIRFLLGSPEDYDRQVYIDACESGRSLYNEGDLYRFQVFFLDGTADHPNRALELLDLLISQVNRLPHSAVVTDDKAPFRNNLIPHTIQDAFVPSQTIHHAQQCQTLDWQQIVEEACLWYEQYASEHSDSLLRWQWLSPARLLKPIEQRENLKNREAAFCRNEQDLTGTLLLSRLYDAIGALLERRHNEKKARQTPPELDIVHGQLFWLNDSYADKHKQIKPMSGLSGQLALGHASLLDISWWTLLITGQYLGIGQQRTFGSGRYQLMLPDGAVTYRRPLPARPLIDQIAHVNNLQQALKHVQSNSRSPESPSPDDKYLLTPDDEREVYDQEEDNSIERLAQQLHNIAQGQYQTPLLKGWLIKKGQHDVRPLAVPPFQDRVLQRAVAQILTPSFEGFMYHASYGYRIGRSRLNAMEDIQQAIKEGYRWVFESDLKDFFDSVNLEHLAVRLYSIFGQDPLVPQLIEWMSADVMFQEERLARHNGLPQGSPLSPLFANLMLDDFDQDMQSQGFRLIRFADDFVVMCKTPQQAKLANQAAQRSLEEHGLSLNQDKTHTKPIEQGLRFLGYLFVNNLTLDVSGEKATPKKNNQEHNTNMVIPPNSWLAKLSQQAIHQLTGQETSNDIARIATPQPEVNRIGERDQTGTVLAITGATPCTLFTRQQRLQIERDDQLLVNTPWQHLQAVILFGNHHITTPALKAAMAADVAIHLANGMGRYQGTCWNGKSLFGDQLWLRQQAAFTDDEAALLLAKQIVDSRIHHCIGVLKRRGLKGTKQLATLKKELHNAKDRQGLNGYEGAAARSYFQALASYLPTDFAFHGRNRQPPKDPFNVMLSLGYTLLYGYVDSLIRVSGLLPTLGFYHQPHGSHSGLASDLMEPFRHIVERTALAMVRKGQINITDFEQGEESCIMDKKAVRRYLAHLTQQFETPQPLADNYRTQWLTQQEEAAATPQDDIINEHQLAQENPASSEDRIKDKRRLTDLIVSQNWRLIRYLQHNEPFTPWKQQ